MKRFVTRLHLWTGLLLGLQFLVWMSSGVVMSWFPIEQVRGEHNIAEPSAVALAAAADYRPPAEILARAGGAANRLTLVRLLGAPVYLLEGKGRTLLFDAHTGKRLSPLPREMALAIARADFSGRGDAVDAVLLRITNTEYRKQVPVWRVVFDDPEHTRIYVSPDSGKVEARRNATWRLYDFFWMLHIMDYDERTDFNNPLIMTASATGLMFALSGLALVLYRLGAGRYVNDLRLLVRRRRKRP